MSAGRRDQSMGDCRSDSRSSLTCVVTFADAVEKVRKGDSCRLPTVIAGLSKAAAERLPPKAANKRCRLVAVVRLARYDRQPCFGEAGWQPWSSRGKQPRASTSSQSAHEPAAPASGGTRLHVVRSTSAPAAASFSGRSASASARPCAAQQPRPPRRELRPSRAMRLRLSATCLG